MEIKFDESITTILESTDFFSHYHFDLDSGYGDMLYYHLFRGIDIVYNDFNADNCDQLNTSGEYDDFIIINHCNRVVLKPYSMMITFTYPRGTWFFLLVVIIIFMTFH